MFGSTMRQLCSECSLSSATPDVIKNLEPYPKISSYIDYKNRRIINYPNINIPYSAFNYMSFYIYSIGSCPLILLTYVEQISF